MNRRPPSFLLVSQASEGFLQYKAAAGLSPRTLERYRDFIKIWRQYIDDARLNEITADKLRQFLIWLRTDYQPVRVTGTIKPLSNKTIHNIYMFLSSFFTWANREFNLPSPLKGVPAPKFEQAPVEPFTKDEVELLLKACEFSVEVRPGDRRKYVMRRAADKRDQALILTLPDTGLRASELSALKIGDADLKSGKAIARPARRTSSRPLVENRG